jgi:hypothetical protein
MLSWILQTTILSIIFIFLIHHLILFFKENLTIPKVKDLVNAPSQKYQDIYNIISSNKEVEDEKEFKYSKEDLLPKADVDSMKNELKSFLKEQLHNKSNTNTSSTTALSELDFYSSDNIASYSTY